jgi:hypothetical protein
MLQSLEFMMAHLIVINDSFSKMARSVRLNTGSAGCQSMLVLFNGISMNHRNNIRLKQVVLRPEVLVIQQQIFILPQRDVPVLHLGIVPFSNPTRSIVCSLIMCYY